MTVIAAVAHDGEVTMGSDTGSVMNGIVSYGRQKFYTVLTDDGARLAIGFGGIGQLNDLTRRHLAIGEPPPHGDDLHDWMVGIAEAICEIASDAKPAALDSDGWVDGGAVVGFRGQIWVLAQQSVDQVKDGYYAFGSGGEVALGHLAATCGQDPIERVAAAIATAARYCDSVAIDEDGPDLVTV